MIECSKLVTQKVTLFIYITAFPMKFSINWMSYLLWKLNEIKIDVQCKGFTSGFYTKALYLQSLWLFFQLDFFSSVKRSLQKLRWALETRDLLNHEWAARNIKCRYPIQYVYSILRRYTKIYIKYKLSGRHLIFRDHIPPTIAAAKGCLVSFLESPNTLRFSLVW